MGIEKLPGEALELPRRILLEPYVAESFQTNGLNC
jgi:hypothetical protein|tara:strand:+ start:3862 stop:3966 length:105 start_codon:yes stop_codon:yes gene_type:complete